MVSSLRWTGTQWDPYLFNTGGSVTNTNSRDGLIPEFFFPDATNTGHMTPRAQMATISGNISWGSEHDNAVITKTIFTGRLKVDCQNITFQDCIFEGAIANDTASLCVWMPGLRPLNVKFIDCTFKPANPDHASHCLMGHHFTATRCDFTGGVDGVSPVAPIDTNYRCDVRIEGCWIHDLAYFSPDSFHSGATDNQTHNDCIQWGAGKGLEVVGCRLEGFADPNIGQASTPSTDSGTTHISGNKSYPSLSVGSGLIPVWAAPQSRYVNSPLGDLTFTGNWVSGGSIGVNMNAGHDGGTNTTFFTAGDALITRNKFGWDFLNGQDYIVNHWPGQSFNYSGNFRWGGSHPKWIHGDAISGPLGNEDLIDPWDTTVPFNILK
jgi:hypothetical protein